MRLWLNILNAAALVAVLAIAGCHAAQSELPENAIVSTTLCADSYIHAMPEIEPRLTALSWQSRSALSVTPNALKSLPQADDDAERLLRWSGALRISSAGGRGDIDLLWGEDFETVWTNFERLSQDLNIPNPSPALQARLMQIEKPAQAPKILYLDRSGATAGPGTFVHTVIEAAGGQNIIQNPGWQSPDTEHLIALQPDLIVTSFMDSSYAGVNDRTLHHAALASKIESLPQINIPGKLWPCAGPGLVEAAALLNRQMLSL